MIDIKYLVFSGGGAAGYAHSGAILQLSQEPEFSFEKIQGVAGSSVGSLAALLVSLKYSPAEISKKLADLDLKKFADGGSLAHKFYRLFTQYGINKGDALYQFIKDIIQEKTGRADPENLTFSDFKDLGYKDLYVVATKIYKENNKPIGKEKIFSLEKTPYTSVAAAILASTTAPVFFRRLRLKKIEKGKYVMDESGDLFEDGGLVDNFPISIFDKPKFISDKKENLAVNPHTLGLALLNADHIENELKQIVKTTLSDKRPLEYAVGIFNTLLLKVEKENLEKSENRKRTIQIDRLGVSLNQFAMGESTKQALMESGKEAVKAYFAALRNEKEPKNVMPFITCKINERDGMWHKAKTPQNDPVCEEEEETSKAKKSCCAII